MKNLSPFKLSCLTLTVAMLHTACGASMQRSKRSDGKDKSDGPAEVTSAEDVAKDGDSCNLTSDSVPSYEQDVAPLMAAHCDSCHSGANATAGFRTDNFAAEGEDSKARWQRAVARIDSGTMPPSGELDAGDKATAVSWAKHGFLRAGEVASYVAKCKEKDWQDGAAVADACDASKPFTPAAARVWRLSNKGYDESVKDLLGIDPKGRESFEAEAGGQGASVLRVSLNQATLYKQKSETVALAATADLPALLGCGSVSDQCVKDFISGFGKKLWRQPVDQDAQGQLFALYKQGQGDTSARVGVQLVLEAMLQSPQFLYRYELGSDGAAPGNVELTGYEIATQLSYYLIGSTPDDELLAAAEGGGLDSSDGVMKHAKRLLASERGKNHFADFFLNLLAIDDLEGVTKSVNATIFNPTIAANMKEEVRQFVKYVTWTDDGKLSTLLSAPYSFVNPALARLYGVTAPNQSGFAKVDLDPSERAGLLTQLGVLTATAEESGTSPLHRGLLVRQNLLCHTLPAPPPEAVEAGVPPVDPTITTRERFAQHSTDPNCSSCHKLVDPIGFSMENFDIVGRFRDQENGLAIDDSGEVFGTKDMNGKYAGAVELAGKLAQSEQVESCMSEQYFTHALGRDIRDADSCGVSMLTESFDSPQDQLAHMALTVVTTDAFRFRKK